LSGGSITDAAGRMTWRLLNTVCPEDVPQGGFLIDYPISFVATPISDKPGYITVKQILPSPCLLKYIVGIKEVNQHH